jgi:hypothetical protein
MSHRRGRLLSGHRWLGLVATSRWMMPARDRSSRSMTNPAARSSGSGRRVWWVAGDGQQPPLDHVLDGPHHPVGAGNVAEQHQPAAGPQDPVHLGDRCLVVGDGVQAKGAHHAVEAGRGERQRLGVGHQQRRRHAQVPGAFAGEGEHCRGEVDPVSCRSLG